MGKCLASACPISSPLKSGSAFPDISAPSDLNQWPPNSQAQEPHDARLLSPRYILFLLVGLAILLTLLRRHHRRTLYQERVRTHTTARKVSQNWRRALLPTYSHVRTTLHRPLTRTPGYPFLLRTLCIGRNCIRQSLLLLWFCYNG